MPFQNEPYADYSVAANRDAMLAAQASVKAQFGKTYDLWLAGTPAKGTGTFSSLNPSAPSEIVGIHQKATPDQARAAVEAAHKYFPEWARANSSSTPGWSTKRARAGPKRKPNSAKLLISATITLNRR